MINTGYPWQQQPQMTPQAAPTGAQPGFFPQMMSGFGNNSGMLLGMAGGLLTPPGQGGGWGAAMQGGMQGSQQDLVRRRLAAADAEKKAKNAAMQKLLSGNFQPEEKSQLLAQVPELATSVLENRMTPKEPKYMTAADGSIVAVGGQNGYQTMVPGKAPEQFGMETDTDGSTYKVNLGTKERWLLKNAPESERSRLSENWERDPNDRTKARPVPFGPADPNTPRPRQPLLATDKTAIMESEDMAARGETAISALKEAKGLSPKINSGNSAGLANFVGRNTGIGGNAAAASDRYNVLIKEQALGSLKALFPGAVSDGEREALMAIQAADQYAPEVREQIIDRAMTVAQRIVDRMNDRASSLRDGSYYQPGFAPGQGQALTVNSPEEAKKLPSGTEFMTPDGRKMRVP